MGQPFNFTTTLDDGETDVEVSAYYYPGCDAVMYLKNGDPGYPAEDPEIDIRAVYLKGDSENLLDALTDDEYEYLEEYGLEMADDREALAEPDPEDYKEPDYYREQEPWSYHHDFDE